MILHTAFQEQGLCLVQHKLGRVGEVVAQSSIRMDSSLLTRSRSVGAASSSGELKIFQVN